MFNFIEYMRQVATRLKEIKHTDNEVHFYRMSGPAGLEELLAKMTHGSFPAIAVEDNLEGRLIDLDSDNVFDREYYVFYVFDRIEFLNHDQREFIKRKLRSIARIIMSKMLKDCRSDINLETNFGLRNLEVSNISYRNIGPFGDGIIAMAVSFTVLEPPELLYSENDWYY